MPHDDAVTTATSSDVDADVDVTTTSADEPLPLPALADTPAEWTETTRETLMRSVRAAPDRYHVRAFIETATGDVHEVVVVPEGAAAVDTPRIDPDADTAPTPREHAALYEVRLPAAPFLSYDDLGDIEAAVRDHHDQAMDELGTDPGDRTPGLVAASAHQQYRVAVGDDQPGGVGTSVRVER